MKRFQSLFLNEPYAKSIAGLMKSICYIVVALGILGLILSMMGRQTFILHAPSGTYNHAIYAEESHEQASRWFAVSLKDDIYVSANDKIDIVTQIGLSTMYAFTVIPMGISFWFLGRVFRNISNGDIFTEQNANYLLYYGLIQIATALFVPFIKLFICYVTNFFTSNELSIGTGQDIISDLVPNIAFIVAAYIIHYGIHLQDEADHTL